MKVLIIEDEIPAQRLLAGLISDLRPDWQIEAKLASIEESLDWFKSNKVPDLIFLDVQLSDGLGFEILEKIKPDSFIIFTTAYDQYAIRAFKVNTIDYILKPIKKAELLQAIEKYENRTEQFQQLAIKDLNLESILNSFNQSTKQYRSRFLINKGEKWLKLNVKEIALIHSENRISYAILFDKTKHVIEMTMEKIIDELNPDYFFRVNRQFIVNIDAIKGIENWFNNRLLVKTKPNANENIIVSREKTKFFKSWLNS